ncbi:MAG: hypothetical protein JXA54_06300 [Candidatus Heimdallarchaeota archaeon]|nr:hypothetical protein [Candidatus Heimdallarchaeota archaeon]
MPVKEPTTGQPNPKFASFLSEKQIKISIAGGVIIIDELLNLKLTDEQEFWEQYKQEVSDFYDWFDETKDQVEAEFKSQSGEAKIAASKKLISFILEAQEKWLEIQCPSSGEWLGELTIKLTPQGIQFPISGSVSAQFQMELNPPTYPLGPSIIKGTISDGSTKIDVTGLDASGDFAGEIVGIAEKNVARICTKFRYSKIMIENPFKQNTPLAIFNRVDNHTFVGVWKAFESILGPMPPIAAGDESIYYELKLQGLAEDFEYEPYLIKYYTWHVQTFNEVRKAIFDSIPSESMKKHVFAFETIELLREIWTDGIALGIPENIQREVGLVLMNEQSLFDKWFRLWFPAALGFWNNKIQQQKTIENLSNRVKFILEAAMEQEVGFFSKQPFIDFNLTVPGSTLDSAYKAYYLASVDDWLKKIKKDNSQATSALDWILQQSILAEGTISTKACMEIGLLPPPPKAQQQFLELWNKR